MGTHSDTKRPQASPLEEGPTRRVRPFCDRSEEIVDLVSGAEVSEEPV